MAVEPFPFATVDELKERWPDFPLGGEGHAAVLLDDASQYILDVCPSAASVSSSTRRRVVCAVVRRAMQAESNDLAGMESQQMTAGPYSQTYKPLNPHGDFYLTSQERKALGFGRQAAFEVDLLAGREPFDPLSVLP
ncbi:hypothetical protein D9V30_00085 [Mycetocola reblochoni]|uniref:Uncharacterized protein n=1 Tax=Mycetocola reblochoni TaxID=331618 RepID=A0A3L6ZUY8_9MICO|nr:Gp19/Gp15/Gp42 family protein [Mycetocola reblochoni]RLP70872.1 hypothetical protein D9V30_00085 [Mycetocola reblochoni]